MRIIYPSGNLTLPTDRNPSTTVLTFTLSTAADHVETSRASYTVPVGRRAIIGGIELRTYNITAITAALLAYTRLALNPAGANKTIATTFLQKIAIDSSDLVMYTVDLIGYAGDVFDLRTNLQHTTGTVRYDGSVVITEYDA